MDWERRRPADMGGPIGTMVFGAGVWSRFGFGLAIMCMAWGLLGVMSRGDGCWDLLFCGLMLVLLKAGV